MELNSYIENAFKLIEALFFLFCWIGIIFTITYFTLRRCGNCKKNGCDSIINFRDANGKRQNYCPECYKIYELKNK